MRSQTTRFAALAAIPLALALMTGCSAGSSNADSTSKNSSASEYKDMYEWQLAYAKCMRGEGIDMEDPDPNGGAQVAHAVEDEAAMNTASDKCTKKVGEAPSSGETKSPEQIKEDSLKIAKCVRDAGYDMADPEGDGTGITLPDNISEDVMKKCLPGLKTMTSDKG